MIYDYYEEKNGYVSLWLGMVKNEGILDKYISTVYQQEDEDDNSFQIKLNDLFLPENRARPYERQFRELFDEFYNQFEYDFGLTFDDDFREITYIDEPTNDTNMLIGFIGKHSYANTFVSALSDILDSKIHRKYNAILLIYNCKYDGHINAVHHSGIEICFMGSVPFDVR